MKFGLAGSFKRYVEILVESLRLELKSSDYKSPVLTFKLALDWCGQRDSNPTSHLRRRLLRPLCLPTAYTPAYNSQDLGFLREPNTKLRRSFNTTWYSRWDSNPQHLPPEDSASAKLRHDCI